MKDRLGMAVLVAMVLGLWPLMGVATKYAERQHGIRIQRSHDLLPLVAGKVWTVAILEPYMSRGLSAMLEDQAGNGCLFQYAMTERCDLLKVGDSVTFRAERPRSRFNFRDTDVSWVTLPQTKGGEIISYAEVEGWYLRRVKTDKDRPPVPAERE